MSCSRVVLRKWIRDHVWSQVARGLSREDHGARSQCKEHGIMPFRWPWLFRNLVVRAQAIVGRARGVQINQPGNETIG